MSQTFILIRNMETLEEAKWKKIGREREVASSSCHANNQCRSLARAIIPFPRP